MEVFIPWATFTHKREVPILNGGGGGNFNIKVTRTCENLKLNP